MKPKVILFFAVAIIIAACSNHEAIDSTPMIPIKSTTNNIRSYEDALKIAQASISMLNDSKSSTRGELNTRKIDLDNSKKVVKLDNKTRSDLGVNDTLIYVFNFENNEGFVLVSAYKNSEALLAITEKGHYVPNVKTPNEGFNLFIDMAKQYIINRGSEIDTTECEYVNEYIYTHNYTGPYVNVKWGLTHPEGEFCPNGISGCTITAMAQFMSYYEYPQSIPLTYPDADRSSQTLNWSLMKSHSTQHTLQECSPNNVEVHTSIGRLCRQLGYKAGSNYSDPNATSTGIYSAAFCLEYYGYQIGWWTDYSITGINDSLSNGKPLLISGRLNDGRGHTWILDGYDEIQYWIYAYEIKADGSRILLFTNGPYSTMLYHFNWGWYGQNDGYFNSNVFATDQAIFTDTNNNSISYNFDQGVVTLSAIPNSQ